MDPFSLIKLTAPDFGACPRCGDSLMAVHCIVPDHGAEYTVALAWCMDCRRVRAQQALRNTREGVVREPRIVWFPDQCEECGGFSPLKSDASY